MSDPVPSGSAAPSPSAPGPAGPATPAPADPSAPEPPAPAPAPAPPDPAATAAPLPPLSLVLGGARSGKSAFAERLVEAEAPRAPRVYLATAERRAGDPGLLERIRLHEARRGPLWRALEAPLEPAAAAAGADPRAPLLLECLTLWTARLLEDGRDPAAEAPALLEALAARPGPSVAVACEVGLGVVPADAGAARFRDAAGAVNALAAARAERVWLVAAGLPLRLK